MGINSGKLKVYTGSMYAGKSTALLNDIEKAKKAGLKVVVIKPSQDNRYSESEVVTHDGVKFPCISLSDPIELVTLEEVINADMVGFDEVQFFSEDIVKIVKRLAYKKMVVCAGLDMDYLGEPFIITTNLMGIADDVYKFHGICAKCGMYGYGSYRRVYSQERVLVGGSEAYQCLCRKCFREVTD